MIKTCRSVQNIDEIETYIASRPPVELSIAVGIVKRITIVGPFMVVLFGAVMGWEGSIAAASGVVIVAGYYLFTGWILSMTAKISLATYYAGALFGFLIRLVLIGVTMAVLANQFDLERVALGVTVAVTYMTLLLWEAASTGRDPSQRARKSTRQRMGDLNGV